MTDSASGVLATYCSELRGLSRGLAALLDVAALRSDLSVLEDTESLIELEAIIDSLRDRIQRTRRNAGEPSSGLEPRPLRNAPAETPAEISIQMLSEPSVQATAAEILDGRGMSSDDELRSWIRQSLGTDTVYDESDIVEELTAGEGHPSPPVPPERTLETLLEHVGSWASIQGTASSMPISSLFTILAESQKTGCLHLRREDEHLRFVFAAGLVVATATTRPPANQRIGEILVGKGVMSSERRQDLVAISQARRRPFGAVAVEMGDLKVAQLTDALHVQVQDRFDRVFRDPHVAYAFVPSEIEESDGHVRVNARALLFESARRADEHSRDEQRADQGDAQGDAANSANTTTCPPGATTPISRDP